MQLQSQSLRHQRLWVKGNIIMCWITFGQCHLNYLTHDGIRPQIIQILVLFVTLPNVWTHHPLRDALFGSVLFLSAIPILPPAVGFPVPYTPPCQLLIKQAPEGIYGEGRDWCRRRWGGSHVHGDVTSLHVSAPPARPESETSCSRGAALHSCNQPALLHLHNVFFTLSFTVSAVSLILTVCSFV